MYKDWSVELLELREIGFVYWYKLEEIEKKKFWINGVDVII